MSNGVTWMHLSTLSICLNKNNNSCIFKYQNNAYESILILLAWLAIIISAKWRKLMLSVALLNQQAAHVTWNSYVDKTMVIAQHKIHFCREGILRFPLFRSKAEEKGQNCVSPEL